MKTVKQLGLIALFIAVGLILSCPNPSSSGNNSLGSGDVVVDLASPKGAPKRLASGFLTGFDLLDVPKFKNPDIQLVKDLKISNYRSSGHRGPNMLLGGQGYPATVTSPGASAVAEKRVFKYTETVFLPSEVIVGFDLGFPIGVAVQMNYADWPEEDLALDHILLAMKEEYDYLMEVSDNKAVYQFFFPDVYTEWSVGTNPFPGDPKIWYNNFQYDWTNPYNETNGKQTEYGDPNWNPAIWTEAAAGTTPGPSNYKWDNYIKFCTALAEFVCDNNMQNNFQYDMWNEPDLLGWDRFGAHAFCNFWQRTEDQWLHTWKVGTRTIRSVHAAKGKPGTAVIAGPSYASDGDAELDGGVTIWGTNPLENWKKFFAFARDNDVLPDVVTMHALDGDPVRMIENLKTKVIAPAGITKTFKYYINEYGGSAKANACNPGNSAWYFGALERADAMGAHSIWQRLYYDAAEPWGPIARYQNESIVGEDRWPYSALGQSGELCGIFRITPEGVYKPMGEWWAYKRYAEMEGQLYSITRTATIEGVASADASTGARILLGAKTLNDISPYWYNAGTVKVRINGINSLSYLQSGGKVKVKIERIPYNPTPATSTWFTGAVWPDPGIIPSGGVVDAPTVVSEQAVDVVDGSILVTIAWGDCRDAYHIIITNP